jgi:hypothetical protein
MRAIDSHIVDEYVVGKWDENSFMVDLAADAEEAKRQLIHWQGALVALLMRLVVAQNLVWDFFDTCGVFRSRPVSNRRSGWMYAYYWSSAQFLMFANVNDFPAKHISVDSIADLRWQLEERRVCCIENRSIGCTVSIWSQRIGLENTYCPFSRAGDFLRFNSLDGLTELVSVFGMLATCWLLMLVYDTTGDSRW